MRKISRHNLLLILVLILALFLRVYRLDAVPIELFGDEIDVGIQAHSILKTGKDYYSNTLPLMFHSFSEYRLPLFIYSDMIFVSIFGLNEWGVRLNSVFWGILGILGIYLLVRKLFNPHTALITSLLLAISPWHLQYSRQGGIEANMLLTAVIYAIYFFFKGLKSFKYLVVSAILFSLSIYTYATAIIFTPLIAGFLIISNLSYLKSIKLKKNVLLVIIILLITLPYLSLFIGGQNKERFASVSIWSDKTLVDEIVKKRNAEDGWSSTIFHNKATVYFYEWSGNVTKALSLDYLFFSGDPNLRHSVGGMGQLYLYELPLLIIGICRLIISRSKHWRLLLAWLIIGIIPASLTRDGGNHGSRLILILIPLIVVISQGAVFLIDNFKKLKFKTLSLIILMLFVFNFSYYLHRYYNDWYRESWRFWQAGFKETMNFTKNIDSKYERVYFSSSYEPSLPRFLFWYQFDPSLFQAQFTSDKIQENIIEGFDGFKLGDKYYFGKLRGPNKFQNFEDLVGKNQLIVISAFDEIRFSEDVMVNPPGGFNILKVVYNSDTLYQTNDQNKKENLLKQPIFYILERKN